MDNLIAEGKIKPFIIVMTYGMINKLKWGHLKDFKVDLFQTVLVDELLPYVDANFHTLSDPSHRGMTGIMTCLLKCLFNVTNLLSLIERTRGTSVFMDDK